MSIIQRSFIPGGKWIYFKLYTGDKTADDILIRVIAPILIMIQKEHYLKKWFFVRYSDPDFHLRIRMLIIDNKYIEKVIHMFYQKLLPWSNNHLIWKVQIDTYDREIERYGKNLMEEAESVFYLDSVCILSIIKKLNGNENYRWMIALKLIDKILSDFCLNVDKKQDLMKDLSNSFKNEFGFNEHNSKQFNTKFRENKIIVESVLNNTFDAKEFILLFKPIDKRTKELLSIVEQIKIKSKTDGRVLELLKSYIHMMINRLFCANNRMHELILYDFMFRYYTSEIAKKKYKMYEKL